MTEKQNKILAFCAPIIMVFAAMLCFAALSADKKTSYTEGLEMSYPVDGGSTIYAGALVVINSSGYAEPLTDAASKIFIGVARQNVDNSAGSDGDETVIVRRKGTYLFTATSITQAHVGSIMYGSADDTFDNTSSNLVPVGRLVKYVSSTSGWIDVENAIVTGSTIAASAVSTADAGAYFAAATDTGEEQLQALAQGPFIVTLPRFTGWTKDGTTDPITTLPALEFPVPVRIKRCYSSVLTAPGADKTVDLFISSTTVSEITGTDTTDEIENLDIAIAANTDVVVSVNETASGAAANYDVILVVYRDDGE